MFIFCQDGKNIRSCGFCIGYSNLLIETPLKVQTGFVNLVYSFYEAIFITEYDRDIYMFWHYVVYIISAGIAIVFLWDEILLCI